MSTDLYADAALTTPAGYIDDPTGDALTADDLPYSERLYFGDPDAGVVIKDGTNPGVDNVSLTIEHLVAEWASSTAKSADDEVRSTAHNGYVYEAQGSGTTGGSEPTWPTTIGATVVDNDITWECVRRTTEPESLLLSLTEVGLDSATPGAALDLGVTVVDGGSANAVDVWVRAQNIASLVNVSELYVSGDHLVNEAA